MMNMAGPDKQFDRDEALNKALEIFWTKGFEATSMQELVDYMGINRASMYQTYGNKNALFTAALDRYVSSSLEQLEQTLEAPGSPLGNLYNIFLHFIEEGMQGEKRGCFINNTAIELGPHDPVIAEKIRDFWKVFENLISEVLKRAIEQNELSGHLDTANTASLLNITLQGLVVKTKTGASKQELIDDTDLLFQFIRESRTKKA